MQRVRKFLVVKNSGQTNSLHRKLLSSLQTRPDIEHLQGWHSTWDFALKCVKDCSDQEVAIVDDDGTWTIIALFSVRNLETEEQEVEPKCKWRSFKVIDLDDCWCNLNYSDFGWGWVSGAQREVPFRLKYFERQLEANPDGLVSRTYAWISEMRDLVLGSRKKIG